MATAAAGAAAAVVDIKNDGKKFFITMPDGSEALLEYELEKGAGGVKILDLTHTFSPPAARGKGLAAKLSDAAFAFARANGYAVRPSCTYISDTYLPSKKGEGATFELDAATGLATAKKMA